MSGASVSDMKTLASFPHCVLREMFSRRSGAKNRVVHGLDGFLEHNRDSISKVGGLFYCFKKSALSR